MTNMQRAVVVLAFIFAVLLGVLLATTFYGGKEGTAAGSLGPSASSAPSFVDTSPSESAAPSASASSAPSASAAPSASPAPTAAPAGVASVSFVQLALDATTDTSGLTRSITFTSVSGTVTVHLTTESGGSPKWCLLGNGVSLGCSTKTTGTLTGKTTKKTETWTVTLRGNASATPVVTVAIAFPTSSPKVTITNARFDGTASPAYNGLQVVATPRAKGSYAVIASWGGHPFLYEVDLIEQGGPGLKQVKATTGATKTTQTFAVAPPNAWMIVLRNTETGFGVTPLTATFTWP